MYSEEVLAGRGVGCVATRDIEEGELIVSEEPALLLSHIEKKRGVSIIVWSPIKHMSMHLEKFITSQEALNLSGSIYNMSGSVYNLSGSVYYMSESVYYVSGSICNIFRSRCNMFGNVRVKPTRMESLEHL